MFRIREVLPFLEGWDLAVDTIKNLVVSGVARVVISSKGEKGWFLGCYMVCSNKYVRVNVKVGNHEFELLPEVLYRKGWVAPLKLDRKPIVTKYSEDYPNSETGVFAISLEPSDWISYVGDYVVTVQLPDKVELPDGTTVYVSSTSATIYSLEVFRVRVRDDKSFFKSLTKYLYAVLTGKTPEEVELQGIPQVVRVVS